MTKPLSVFDYHGREIEVVTLDFETYYEDSRSGYSLRNPKLNSILYVRDPRFKAHGLSYITPAGKEGWITHKDLPKFFADIDWSQTAMLAQNCVTGDHEVFTQDGWVRLDELNGTESILQWSSTTEEASFTSYIPFSKKYTGKMYAWDSLFHQGVYTPDHRVYYATPQITRYRESTIEDIMQLGANNVYFPTSATKLAGEVKFDFTEDQARFIEALRADGSYSKNADKSKVYAFRFKFHKETKRTRLGELLRKLGLVYKRADSKEGAYSTAVYTINIKANEIAHPWLKKVLEFLPSKHYTNNVLYLSQEAQLAILDEAPYWDGSGTNIFSSTKSDMDWLQILAHLNNRNVRLVTRPNTRGWSKPTSMLTQGSLRKRRRAKLQYAPEVIEHDGPVYCVSVPTQAFFVRRNGAVWITGNCAFDALIANEHYGVDAAYYLDTMSMSRGEWGIKERASLNLIGKRLKLGGKLEGELEKTSGIRELSPEQEAALIPYAIQDSALTRKIFEHMYFDMGFPEDELHIIDLTIRAAAVPKLRLNAALCHAEIEDEDRRLETLMESDIIGNAELSSKCAQKVQQGGIAELMRSRPCFAELIRSRGVAPPMKHAKTSKGEYKYDENQKPIYTYAFAKNDIELMNLGEDSRVSDLVAVWTGLKSTIRKTRAETFLAVTQNGSKPLPIPLNYCGAHTMRWSGGENLNPQNLPSGRDGRGARLRESIIAPPGYVIVVSDSSQIEARVNACLWGQDDLLQTFRDKKDPYSELASDMYKVPVSKKGPNAHLRPVGKVMELGLGFGMGPDRFLEGCLSGSITGDIINMTHEEAVVSVEFYRHRRNRIVEGWDRLKQILAHMVSWTAEEKAAGISVPITDFLTAAPDRIIMPNGLSLHYKNLGYHYFPEKNKRELVYEVGKDSNGQPQFNRIWHSKLDENIVQCLARIIVAQQAVQIAKRYDVVLLVHDEVVYLAKQEEANEALAFGLEAMRVPPPWMPDIPLDAEGGFDTMYSK